MYQRSQRPYRTEGKRPTDIQEVGETGVGSDSVGAGGGVGDLCKQQVSGKKKIFLSFSAFAL